jgi:hypothetical protein
MEKVAILANRCRYEQIIAGGTEINLVVTETMNAGHNK